MRHLRRIERVSADEESFWVGTGNKIGQLVTKLSSNEYQRVFPTGNHGGVGTGYLLGCGYGYLSRSLGLACDNIIAAQIVVSSGEIFEVRDDNEHADLLWALRGDGSGQIGIVTGLLLKTYPLSSTPDYSYFRLSWSRSFAGVAVAVWQEWALDDDMTSNFTCRIELWNPPEDEEQNFPSVVSEGILYGNQDELAALLNVVISNIGPPMENTRESFEYMQLLARLYGIANDDTFQVRNPFAGHSGSRRLFYHKSHMIPTRLGTDGIAALINFINEILTGSLPYQSYLAMTPLGGVINPLRPSAFDDQRNSLTIAQYGGSWTTPNQ